MNSLAGFDVKIEFEDFEAIAKFAYDELGLNLGAGKVSLIRSRLRHRLGDLGIASLAEYCDLVGKPENQREKRYLVSALTTNVSSFFREPHHFDVLARTVWPNLREKSFNSQIRIWSAGCSYGQEPLSIAMSMLENLPAVAKNKTRITATDVDFNVVETAKRMDFEEVSTSGLSALRKRRFFNVRQDCTTRAYTARRCLAELVKFQEANLLSNAGCVHRQDVIFCRNVMIYFEKDTQGIVLNRLVSCLNPNGFLFVGHAERADHPSLRPLGGTAYIKAG